MSSDEEWCEIPSLPEYEASSLGRVRRIPYMAQMPYGGWRQYGDHPHFGVWVDSDPRPALIFRHKSYRISKLVCEAFHGKKPFAKACVLHDDDDSTNNIPGNLKWGTQKENLNTPKFIAYCRSRIGENSPTIKARKMGAKHDDKRI